MVMGGLGGYEQDINIIINNCFFMRFCFKPAFYCALLWSLRLVAVRLQGVRNT